MFTEWESEGFPKVTISLEYYKQLEYFIWTKLSF